jgi:hypothetical protein
MQITDHIRTVSSVTTNPLEGADARGCKDNVLAPVGPREANGPIRGQCATGRGLTDRFACAGGRVSPA